MLAGTGSTKVEVAGADGDDLWLEPWRAEAFHVIRDLVVAHLGHLPQGRPERSDRARRMVAQMDAEGFGSCTNHGECEAACPKGISISNIARLNRDFLKAGIVGQRRISAQGEGAAG